MPQPGNIQDRRTLALLGSLCLFLSAIEYLIPKPLPFMRIGLANLPLLLALNIFDIKGSAGARNFFLLVLLKVLGQGLIGGTLFSYVFLFSLAGTFTSAALMYLLRSLLGQKYLGFVGLGCAGAMASNGIQLVLARYLIFGPALYYLIPPFLVSGFVTGIALGLFCEYFCRHSKWYALHTGQAPALLPVQRPMASEPEAALAGERHRLRWENMFSANQLFIAGLLMALIFLFSGALKGLPLPGGFQFGGSLAGRAAQFVFFCLLAALSGKKINPLATILFMAGIVFFNLLAPYGKVIAALGPLRITEGSLFMGLEKALVLGGLLMLSRACIRSDLRLPGIGSLLGESFRILELLREKKGLVRKGHIIAGIDRIMLEIEQDDAPVPDTESALTRRDIPQNPSPIPLKRRIKNLSFVCIMVIFTAALALFTP